MINTQTLVNFPVFGDNATKAQPDNAKYAAGFQPADVYPAEWVNWVWNKASGGVTALNTGVDMMEREINNVLDGADKNPDATKDNQLLESIQKLISDAETRAKLAAHPVGSLYWSKNSTDPATLFGGTWSRVKDKFILAAGDTYSNGNTGGAATVTLQTTQIPSHNHGLNSHTHSVTAAGTVSSHNHGLNSHTHSVTAAGTVSSHNHGLNSHTHSVTAAGTISGGKYSFTGSAVTSGAMSGNATGSTQYVLYKRNSTIDNVGNVSMTDALGGWVGNNGGQVGWAKLNVDVTHTHSVTAAGTVAVTTNPSFTGSAVTSGQATGNTANTQPTFTGSAVTSEQATGNTSSTGGGGSHENMPPYKVYYCWERVS